MKLSIVLAVQGGSRRLPAVLDRLEAQVTSSVEVLVVYADGDSEAAHAVRSSPRAWAAPLSAPSRSLIPDLWARGIRAALADRVALTVVHALPGPQWVAGLLATDLNGHAGVGGPIRQGAAEDGVSWAIYLQRYAPFGPDAVGSTPRAVEEIAGDNAVYDRTLLRAVSQSWDDGFWELAVHAALRARGARLAVDPALWVEHRNGYPAWEFAAQRLRHGLRFGRDRSAAMSLPRRAAYRALSPAIPALFGRKLVGRALGCREARGHLVAATPWMIAFLLAWSVGEAVGALAPVGRG